MVNLLAYAENGRSAVTFLAFPIFLIFKFLFFFFEEF
jgi:hypothetical protein